MYLKEIINNYQPSINYIERRLNDGSPSGFSIKNTTSKHTSPFGLTPWFYPYIAHVKNNSIYSYGDFPDWINPCISAEKDWILIHPDMINNELFLNNDIEISRLDSIKVVPTASGRTIKIINKGLEDYIKLHYVGILGRIRREIRHINALSSIETSELIEKSLRAGLISNKISMLPETGMKILKLKNGEQDYEWGMIWRSHKPVIMNNSIIKYILPAFSLFSFDKFNSYHPKLLKQLIDYCSVDPVTYVVDFLIKPIIDSYFELILKLGLQVEWHAQNLLIGFDENFIPQKFIIRDMESIDKDLTMMELLNLDFDLKSKPYKCINNEQYNYAIKHSFMFDFKLGEYVISPLLEFLDYEYSIDTIKIQRTIKEFTSQYTEKLPKDFFPKSWFSFKPVLVDQSKTERPYVEHQNPKYR